MSIEIRHNGSTATPEKSSSLWSKIKKTIAHKDQEQLHLVKRHSLEALLPARPAVDIRRNQSVDMFSQLTRHREMQPRGESKESLKNAQLELAQHDCESNLLNIRPIETPQTSRSSNSNYTPLRDSQSNIHNGCRVPPRRNNSRSSIAIPRITPPLGPTIPSNGKTSMWGKVRQQYAPSAAELAKQGPAPKLLQISQMWTLIYNAIQQGELLQEESGDPRQWWRKVFVNLRKSHGKAKASTIATQLMQNPEVLSAIQSKLAGLVEEHSNPQAHMASLPQVVRRRIRAMKSLQYKMIQLESQFYEQVHELECKYAELYKPLLHQRSEIVNGTIEPSDEQCSGYPGNEYDILAEETESKLNIGSAEEPEDEDAVGVTGFWLQVFRNVDLLSSMVQDVDEPVLRHLTDVKCIYSKQPMGFTLEFHFNTNDYFTEPVLTKSYELRSEPDEMDPFSFEGPEIVACQGCVVNWKKGKNVTVRVVKKKQKHQKSGTTRMITRHEQQDSFFNFFSPPDVAEGSGDGEGEITEEMEALLQADFEIGHYVRENVIPRAVLIYTGEAGQDDEDYEDDDEDDEDYDDEEDDDEECDDGE